jgi:hypothetical protein
MWHLEQHRPALVSGVERIANTYAAKGANKNLTRFIKSGVGHVLYDEMSRRTKGWFAQQLMAWHDPHSQAPICKVILGRHAAGHHTEKRSNSDACRRAFRPL